MTMDILEPITRSALVAALLLLVSLWWLKRRQGPRDARARRADDDSVLQVAVQPTRVLTVGERAAYELLRRALPGFVVLAQVPLVRFLRVDAGPGTADWLQRVGRLNADLVLCDAGSRVLAVIDVRSAQESERSRQRHERLARALKAAGITVYAWREDELPSIVQVRALFSAALGEVARKAAEASRPMPLIPVAEIEEVLAEGDAAFADRNAEPVPSGFFDEMEPALGRR